MNIVIKSVDEMTPLEYRACYAANYGPGGYMQEVLSLYRNSQNWNGAIAIMLVDPDKKGTASLMAWCLMTPVTRNGLLGVTRYTMSKSKYTVEFWVKRQYRRKGLAKILMAEVKKIDPRPHVFPHDNPSAEFFSSYEVTVLSTDRGWMKRKSKVA